MSKGQKRSPMRWARGKTEGRMRHLPTWELKKAGEVIVRAQQDRTTGLWFWYGLSRNTASNMRELSVVKTEAEEFARAALASRPKED